VIKKLDRRSINQGETLGFTFGMSRKDGVGSDGLSCEITIRAKRGGIDLISPREIQPDAKGLFVGTLSVSETDLPPGEYFLLATITGTDLRREIEQRFTVREAW
jgi:hypothetical protein